MDATGKLEDISEVPCKKVKVEAVDGKTPISILQELMVKRGEQLQFEQVYQGGPPHQMIFKYQCTAAGASAISSGRSKKDAKQEAARLCLEKLASVGEYKPQRAAAGPFAHPSPQRTVPPPPDEGNSSIYSYVALMKEYCEEYRLPAPQYELVSDTGPPHCREFEMRVEVGAHSRTAVASTKKQARQLAAQRLYEYLKENLTRVTQDFVEEDALVRANQKAQEKYLEMKEDVQPWRPNLGQKVSEYHIEESLQRAAMQVIDDIASDDNLVDKVEEVLRALQFEWEWELLPSHEKYKVVVMLNVPKAYPSITIASPPEVEAVGKKNTARQALEYIKLMLL